MNSSVISNTLLMGLLILIVHFCLKNKISENDMVNNEVEQEEPVKELSAAEPTQLVEEPAPVVEEPKEEPKKEEYENVTNLNSNEVSASKAELLAFVNNEEEEGSLEDYFKVENKNNCNYNNEMNEYKCEEPQSKQVQALPESTSCDPQLELHKAFEENN